MSRIRLPRDHTHLKESGAHAVCSIVESSRRPKQPQVGRPVYRARTHVGGPVGALTGRSVHDLAMRDALPSSNEQRVQGQPERRAQVLAERGYSAEKMDRCVVG
jgi:hypothetical protein